jgi:hypothetical protein
MPDSIITHSADDAIRRNEPMFFGSIGPHPALIAARIAEGALLLGCHEVAVISLSGWWCVCSTSDWLNAPNAIGVSESNAFDAAWPLPELGHNGFRSEIFSRMYAASTVTCTGGNVLVISGDANAATEFMQLVRNLPYDRRVIGFRFANDV